MTLIEVVASLALLGTLLGAAAVAKGRLNRQWQFAHDRAEAIAWLDAQVTAWHLGLGTDEINHPQDGHPGQDISGGELGGNGWTWRAEPIGLPDQAGLRLIRFTAYRLDSDTLATIDVFAGYESTSESSLALPIATGRRGVRP